MKHRTTEIAGTAIELALRGQEFKTNELRKKTSESNGASKSTLYRVLKQLEEDEWVHLEGKTWVPGVKARVLSDPGNEDVVDRDVDMAMI